jgi:hypothetical protein
MRWGTQSSARSALTWFSRTWCWLNVMSPGVGQDDRVYCWPETLVILGSTLALSGLIYLLLGSPRLILRHPRGPQGDT